MSPNVKYLIENVSTDDNGKPQINITQLPDGKIIQTLESSANNWQFDPHSRYALFCIANRFDFNYIPAFLYSLKTRTEISLCSNPSVLVDTKPAISPNGQYIAYRFVPREGEKYITRLLEYNDHFDTISEVSLKNLETSNLWAFCPHGEGSRDQHFLYIPEDQSSLIKIDLPCKTLMNYSLDPDKNYTNIYANQYLITLQRDNAIDLFTMGRDTVQPLKTIPTDIYNSNIINILTLIPHETIAHQYKKDSFAILSYDFSNRNYKEIASYTFKNENKNPEIYYASIQKLITNRTCRNLIALYAYNKEASPSSVVFFDLNQMNGIRKDFKEQIHSIQFINDKHILAHGIKAYVYDMQGNKIGNVGECQSIVAHENSIAQISHTPNFAYSTKLGGYKKIPMKTKVRLLKIDKEKLSQLDQDKNHMS